MQISLWIKPEMILSLTATLIQAESRRTTENGEEEGNLVFMVNTVSVDLLVTSNVSR